MKAFFFQTLGLLLLCTLSAQAQLSRLANGTCSLEKRSADGSQVTSLLKQKDFQIDLWGEDKAHASVELGSFEGLSFRLSSPLTVTVPVLSLDISANGKPLVSSLRESSVESVNLLMLNYTLVSGDVYALTCTVRP